MCTCFKDLIRHTRLHGESPRIHCSCEVWVFKVCVCVYMLCNRVCVCSINVMHVLCVIPMWHSREHSDIDCSATRLYHLNRTSWIDFSWRFSSQVVAFIYNSPALIKNWSVWYQHELNANWGRGEKSTPYNKILVNLRNSFTFLHLNETNFHFGMTLEHSWQLYKIVVILSRAKTRNFSLGTQINRWRFLTALDSAVLCWVNKYELFGSNLYSEMYLLLNSYFF